jgi:hypothetical protein
MNREKIKKKIKHYIRKKVEETFPDDSVIFVDNYVKMCFINMAEDCEDKKTPIANIIREIVDELDHPNFQKSDFKSLK